jgi:hypothetical protein
MAANNRYAVFVLAARQKDEGKGKRTERPLPASFAPSFHTRAAHLNPRM